MPAELAQYIRQAEFPSGLPQLYSPAYPKQVALPRPLFTQMAVCSEIRVATGRALDNTCLLASVAATKAN